jgi:hypothetical protein
MHLSTSSRLSPIICPLCVVGPCVLATLPVFSPEPRRLDLSKPPVHLISQFPRQGDVVSRQSVQPIGYRHGEWHVVRRAAQPCHGHLTARRRRTCQNPQLKNTHSIILATTLVRFFLVLSVVLCVCRSRPCWESELRMRHSLELHV